MCSATTVRSFSKRTQTYICAAFTIFEKILLRPKVGVYIGIQKSAISWNLELHAFMFLSMLTAFASSMQICHIFSDYIFPRNSCHTFLLLTFRLLLLWRSVQATCSTECMTFFQYWCQDVCCHFHEIYHRLLCWRYCWGNEKSISIPCINFTKLSGLFLNHYYAFTTSVGCGNSIIVQAITGKKIWHGIKFAL